MSRRPLRGAALADVAVALPLRPRPPAPPPPAGSPEVVLEAARAEALAIVEAARAEAEGLSAAAVAEGLAAGRREAMAETAAVVAAAGEMAAALGDARHILEEEAVREATVLSVEIAAKLLRAEVAARPERVADVLRGAIRRAADRSRLVARVNPDDLAACRAAAPAVMEEMGGIAGLQVVDDPRVARGSCVLETTAGDVDATFESQLARVLEALAAPADELLVEPAAQ